MSENEQKKKAKLFRIHLTIGKKPDHERQIRYQSFPLRFLVFAKNYGEATEHAVKIFERDISVKDDQTFIKSKKGEEIKYDAIFKSDE